MPLFQPLPAPKSESVARAMKPLAARAGDIIVREADSGELLYASRRRQGPGRRRCSFAKGLTRGDGFGEIALLNDTPRTATVSATTDVSLYTLASDHFLTAVMGAPDVHRKARTLVEDRLAQLDTEPAADLPG